MEVGLQIAREVNQISLDAALSVQYLPIVSQVMACCCRSSAVTLSEGDNQG